MRWLLIILLGIFGTLNASIGPNNQAPHKCPLRHVTITNRIQPEMLEYTYLQKRKFSPDSFNLHVNNQPLKPGASICVPIENNRVKIRYDYSFARGWYSGGKITQFILDPEKETYDLHFSWNDSWRISAQGARPEKVVKKL